MRTVSFKEVLRAVAYKLGLDPTKEFLTDEAESLTSYINAWVRRTWDSRDWPEWTDTLEFTPDARHMVAYHSFPVGASAPVLISRPWKVYLVDPLTTPYPIDTRFRENDEGLHVGFDHGTSVWIKFTPLPPRFTSIPWDNSVTYPRDALVYSTLSGQCYRSKTNANMGNDPTGQQGADPTPLTVTVIQPAVPAQPAIPARPQITKVTQRQELLGTWQTEHTWKILDATGAVIGSTAYSATAYESAAGILTAIYNALRSVPALSNFSFTLDTAKLTIQIQAEQFFAVSSYYYANPASADETVVTGDPINPTELVIGDDAANVTVGTSPAPPLSSVYNTITNVQYYADATPFIPGVAGIIELSMSAESAIPGASYNLAFTDTSALVHSIEYVNPVPGLSAAGVLQGIVNEIQVSPDPFFDAMSALIDPALLRVQFAALEMVALDAEVVRMENPWWERVLFPLALMEPVTRGAYGDALREAGQTDKAMAEEQGAVQEEGDRANKVVAPAYDNLTDQQRPAPRYRTRPVSPPAGR